MAALGPRWRVPLGFAVAGATVGWLSTWLIELVTELSWGCRIPGEPWQRAALAALGGLAMAFAALITRNEMEGPGWARATAARVVGSCAVLGAVPGLLGGGMFLLQSLASGLAVGVACVPWALLIVAGHRAVAVARRGSLLEGAERAAFALAFLCGVMLVPWCASRQFVIATLIVASTALSAVAIGMELLVRRRRLQTVAQLFAAQPIIDAHAAVHAPVCIDVGLGDDIHAVQRGGHPYRGGGLVRAACRGQIDEAERAAHHLLLWAAAVLGLGTVQLALIGVHVWTLAREVWWC